LVKNLYCGQKLKVRSKIKILVKTHNCGQIFIKTNNKSFGEKSKFCSKICQFIAKKLFFDILVEK